MRITSGRVLVHVDLSVDESRAIARFLHAREFGGEMVASDAQVVKDFLAGLKEQNNTFFFSDAIAEVAKGDKS